MVKKYYNKGYINEIVSRVYGFIGYKGVDMVKLSDIYAECAQAQKYYTYVLEHFPNDSTNRAYCQSKLKEMKVKLQATKPWWKVW